MPTALSLSQTLVGSWPRILTVAIVTALLSPILIAFEVLALILLLALAAVAPRLRRRIRHPILGLILGVSPYALAALAVAVSN